MGFDLLWPRSMKKIRTKFPQVYSYQKKTKNKDGEEVEATYWLVSARSKQWGLNERKNFNAEKEALDYAKQIAEQILTHGSSADVPKEKLVQADAYAKLVERLTPYGKTPEDATDHYLKFLGSELVLQAKPFVKELVTTWETEKLTSKIRPLSNRTKSELKMYARYLKRIWGELKAHDINRKMVEGELNKLPAKNRNTHRKYLRYIRMFFIWLKDHKELSDNPTDGIKIKGEAFEAHFYKPEIVKNILRYVVDHEPDLIGYYALLTFAGLRPSEGARVQWGDIDFDTGELYVRKGKKEARRFVLHPTALEWLNYFKKSLPKDAPFVILKNLANRESEIRRQTLNGGWIQDGLRHGMATYYNALVKDAYKAAHVLGDNIQTIKRHYMREVAEQVCKSFWGMTPEVVAKD